MLIGGFALPAYGQIRATQDLDMAIAAEHDESVKLQKRLRELSYLLPSKPQPEAPVFVVTDLKNMLEVEIWTRPDGITFDNELLRRRVRVRPFNDHFQMFAIGPEDFIVNKLARRDRGTQDETDVVSVLKRQMGKLDYVYLAKRAKKAGVVEQLQMLMTRSNTQPTR